jgi:hypothetical protein
MSTNLCLLTTDELRTVASALRAGRLLPPFTALAVGRLAPAHLAPELAVELQDRTGQGYSPTQLADLIDLLVTDRARHIGSAPPFDLVWTGPETAGVANRDTAVVVRELFRTAERSLLLAGYAVYQGQSVFRALADRMDENPGLAVRMFLDVRRPDGDTSSEAEIVRRFAARFRERDWPGRRLPALYYDPRSVDLNPQFRASLHAKCIVVDHRQTFISSANFTEAAQLRNIEVGVLLRSPQLSIQLTQHFDHLADARLLKPIPLGCV